MPEEADGGGRSPAGLPFGERSQLSKDQEGLILAADDRSIPIVVAASPEAETPQLAQSSDPLPIPVESEDKSPDQTDSPKDLEKKLAEASESGSSRLYGIKRRTFFLIILGIVITIGVVIGGALGGTLPSRKHKEPSPMSVVLYQYELTIAYIAIVYPKPALQIFLLQQVRQQLRQNQRQHQPPVSKCRFGKTQAIKAAQNSSIRQEGIVLPFLLKATTGRQENFLTQHVAL